jgi:hypothetical protein
MAGFLLPLEILPVAGKNTIGNLLNHNILCNGMDFVSSIVF